MRLDYCAIVLVCHPDYRKFQMRNLLEEFRCLEAPRTYEDTHRLERIALLLAFRARRLILPGIPSHLALSSREHTHLVPRTSVHSFSYPAARASRDGYCLIPMLFGLYMTNEENTYFVQGFTWNIPSYAAVCSTVDLGNLYFMTPVSTITISTFVNNTTI